MKPEIAATLTQDGLVVLVYLFMTNPTRVYGRSIGVGRVENHRLIRWIHFAMSTRSMHHSWQHAPAVRAVLVRTLRQWTLGVRAWTHSHLHHCQRRAAVHGVIKRIMHHHAAAAAATIGVHAGTDAVSVVLVGGGWCLRRRCWIWTRKQFCQGVFISVWIGCFFPVLRHFKRL